MLRLFTSSETSEDVSLISNYSAAILKTYFISVMKSIVEKKMLLHPFKSSLYSRMIFFPTFAGQCSFFFFFTNLLSFHWRSRFNPQIKYVSKDASLDACSRGYTTSVSLSRGEHRRNMVCLRRTCTHTHTHTKTLSDNVKCKR